MCVGIVDMFCTIQYTLIYEVLWKRVFVIVGGYGRELQRLSDLSISSNCIEI